MKTKWEMSESDFTQSLEESYADLGVRCRIGKIRDYQTYCLFSKGGAFFYENQNFESCAVRLDIERRFRNNI